jgi:microcystin degradation protein MlrC
MAQRYVKVSIGTRTYFRSSATRIYLSASRTKYDETTFHSHARGTAPCVEITKQEFDALRAEVLARCRKANPAFPAKHLGPSDSWVEVAS